MHTQACFGKFFAVCVWRSSPYFETDYTQVKLNSIFFYVEQTNVKLFR